MTPQDDWEHINEEFADWFQGQYGPYSTRLEYFFGDCEVKDETLRKDLILKWVKSAFEVGYKKGNYDNRIPKEPAQTPHQSPCGCLIIHSYTQRPLMKEQQIRVKILPQLERFSEDLLYYYCSDEPALKYMVRKLDQITEELITILNQEDT